MTYCSLYLRCSALFQAAEKKNPKHLDLRDTYHTKSKLVLLLWCLTPVNVLHCASYVYFKNKYRYLIISHLNMNYLYFRYIYAVIGVLYCVKTASSSS